MKKILLTLLMSLLLTGCFGEVGSGIITKTCTKTIEEDGLIIKEERVVKNEGNNIILIIYKDTITNNGNDEYYKALINSYTSEVNSLKNDGITATIENDKDSELVVTYNFDYSVINEDIKEKYNFKELNSDQIKKYEEEGYSCK